MDAKKIAVVAVVVAFLGFWMLNDPAGLAETAKSAGSEGWSLTTDVFRGIISFLGEL